MRIFIVVVSPRFSSLSSYIKFARCLHQRKVKAEQDPSSSSSSPSFTQVKHTSYVNVSLINLITLLVFLYLELTDACERCVRGVLMSLMRALAIAPPSGHRHPAAKFRAVGILRRNHN